MSNPPLSASFSLGMNHTLMTLYIEPDMPGIDDLVITITRLQREGWAASELTFRVLSSAAYQAIPPEAFTDPMHHRLKEYVSLSREFGLISGARHYAHLRGVIRRGIMSGIDRSEVIRRILSSPYYSAHEQEITYLIRSLVRRNNRVALNLLPRMFRYKAFGVVETGSGYPRRPETVCLLAGYLRDQEEIRASQARLALLNTEVEKENAQEYARTKIPASRLAHFRLWFTRRFGNDTSRLMESVDTYCEEQNPVMDEKPTVLPLPRGHLPHADIRMRSPSSRREVSVRDVHVQSQFRELVDNNFGSLCAVSGKHLNGVLEAAHIEPTSVAGCYNASNGILLSPTFHRLFDTNMMGIDPDTLQVHFASGIEFPEYEGVCIKPLIYNLDKNRLRARWLEFMVNAPAE
ncbi:HNH endonuclease [Salmonella enterica subsp. enterica]